ncbi:hypothetical protein EVA_15114 [gut metagenome]|uniref:Uncharacterized protein n=1 Tax=gut metagenome TaxID=749906 RepID=J9GBI4_9ZZZZ
MRTDREQKLPLQVCSGSFCFTKKSQCSGCDDPCRQRTDGGAEIRAVYPHRLNFGMASALSVKD